jgi:5-methylcytosine-specific restriction endonuclease McrA
MVRIPKTKSMQQQCMELWKVVVKKRAKESCEKCGSLNTLQCHHIIPRTNYSLRFDLENGVCLCKSCHIYWAHKDAVAFYHWVKDVRNIDYLESARHRQSKNDYNAIFMYLLSEAEK